MPMAVLLAMPLPALSPRAELRVESRGGIREPKPGPFRSRELKAGPQGFVLLGGSSGSGKRAHQHGTALGPLAGPRRLAAGPAASGSAFMMLQRAASGPGPPISERGGAAWSGTFQGIRLASCPQSPPDQSAPWGPPHQNSPDCSRILGMELES